MLDFRFEHYHFVVVAAVAVEAVEAVVVAAVVAVVAAAAVLLLEPVPVILMFAIDEVGPQNFFSYGRFQGSY